MNDLEGPLGRLEQQLGRVLVTGVTISAGCLAGGLLLFFLPPHDTAADWLLNVGLMVLMATPILRVVVSALEYVRMRDWFFAATTVAVLGVLATTVLFALSRR
jgi:uncharacterized membrane protein